MKNRNTSLNLLDEDTFREFIENTVRLTVEEKLLSEMTFDLKTYKDRIRNHAVQITTNWCLVRYTLYDENFKQLRNHWMAELKAHLNMLAVAKVSVSHLRMNSQACHEQLSP